MEEKQSWKPALGRIVHVRVDDPAISAKPVFRPAMIVAVWNDDCVNLQIDLDGENDRGNGCHSPFTHEERARGRAWRTSVTRGEGTGHWIVPPRV